MDPSGTGDVAELDAARTAYGAHDWAEARARYARADAVQELSAEDLVQFGEALWWTAHLEEAITIRERAYTAFLANEDRTGAAQTALWLFIDYSQRLQFSLAAGALIRAERQLAEEPEGPVHGQLLLMQAMRALDEADHDGALQLTEDARTLARTYADPDLESLGLLLQGRALVSQGDVANGMRLLDEAAVAAVGGELRPFTTGVIYCMTISACTDLADYRRASEWTEAAERWCHQQAVESGFPGTCRVYRAGIKRFQGLWQQAEQEARRAAEEMEDSFFDVAGAAYAEIGELRLRLGDLEGAEQGFQRAYEFGSDAQPGISLLRLAQGRHEAALASVRTSLDNPFLQPLGRAKLLPALVEIALAADEVDEAAAAADELAAIAEQYQSPSPALNAAAADAAGAVALARGEPKTAVERLRAALRAWQQLRAPYESARTRLLLTRVYDALGDTETAAFEARAAKGAFERLGAVPDARRAAEAVGGRPAPRRVTRTFLFTDVVTSTTLIEAIGDAAWSDLVGWHDQTLRRLFSAMGGEIVDHAGDGFFVAFETATEALACAVAIQRRLAEHRREHGFAPRVRIGVHAADALRDNEGYRGGGVHEAARIGGLAEGGQILSSHATVQQADDPVPSTEPWSVTLRGASAETEITEILWDPATSDRTAPSHGSAAP